MKLAKSCIFTLAALAAAPQLYCEDNHSPTVNIALDARADFDLVDTEGSDGAKSGIYGRYFNLKVDGSINSQWSYSWRQRLNKYKDSDNDVFAGTDWINLSYQATKNWAVSAGKQVVLVGGYEYDAPPIDVFYACRFWNNFPCYQFGATASYTTDNGKHTLSAQITNSPYHKIGDSFYAYNLFWTAHLGWYQSMWSINWMEYDCGKYVNFISLGNKADFGPLSIELDVMNRAMKGHKYWFGDYSIIAKAEYSATSWLTVWAKGGKDNWHSLPGEEYHVDKPFYGGGLFFFPDHGKRDVRIHAIADCYYDNSGQRNTEINIGLTWRMNIFSKQ